MIKLVMLILLSYLFVVAAKAQDALIDTALVKNIDTVCFKYKFNPGDTITYRIASFDSIAINYGKPILKNRYEKIQIVCDSVKNHRFYLSQELLQYIGMESSGEIRDIRRTESPWLGRKVCFSIDSSGNRFSLGYDDSIHAALTPGGAFQPQLIFPFHNTCTKIDRTWISESIDELVENGLPLPLVKQSSLFRALPPIDTLDEHCNRLNYIKTGQGSYKVEGKDDTLRVTSIITGFGVLDISVEKWIPIHYLATEEIKLTISIGDKEPQPGWNYILSYYTLDSYKPGKDIHNNKKKK